MPWALAMIAAYTIASAAPGAPRLDARTVNESLPCPALDPHGLYADLNDPNVAYQLNNVEEHHFPPQVERLEKGFTAPLPRDIAFVLRQIPNHYRALNAMARWQLANRISDDPESDVWSADCYFQRAIAFSRLPNAIRPDDWRVHLLYGIYLQQTHRLTEAAQQYADAAANGAAGAEFYYDRGLLEVDMGDLAKAEADAKKAYALNYPLPGLKDKIARARERKKAAD